MAGDYMPPVPNAFLQTVEGVRWTMAKEEKAATTKRAVQSRRNR